MRSDGNLLKNVLIGKINKKRPLGRPIIIWKDTVEKNMKLIEENAMLDWILVRAKMEMLTSGSTGP